MLPSLHALPPDQLEFLSLVYVIDDPKRSVFGEVVLSLPLTLSAFGVERCLYAAPTYICTFFVLPGWRVLFALYARVPPEATAMGNLSEVQRVVYRHDWQCVASALGDLAHLTDDEIDRLARSDQKTQTSLPCNGPSLAVGRKPQASWGMLQAIRRNIGSRLRSRASKSLVLLLPRVRH
jgi:hypothetical protein